MVIFHVVYKLTPTDAYRKILELAPSYRPKFETSAPLEYSRPPTLHPHFVNE